MHSRVGSGDVGSEPRPRADKSQSKIYRDNTPETDSTQLSKRLTIITAQCVLRLETLLAEKMDETRAEPRTVPAAAAPTADDAKASRAHATAEEALTGKSPADGTSPAV